MEDFEMLVKIWRDYVASFPEASEAAPGYASGLKVCADQLSETIERYKRYAEESYVE